MFSQISAKGRGSSVPSPERLLTSAWTFSASWRRALRTGTGGLQFWDGFDRKASLCARNCFVNASARCATCDVMAINRGGQRDARVEVFTKGRRERVEFVKRESVQ